jgi:hypothetical protein
MLWIRVRIHKDPHHFGNLDQHQIKIRIRIHISFYKLDPGLDPDPHQFADVTSQNVWNISLV